ncbi:MAG: hypothetical protein ING02_04490 [Roseomonas sp.]|nr:hypothetical protein [Roseomonas sp.]
MLGPTSNSDATPLERLKVAQPALKVETQRLALDESKGQLLDVAAADASIGEIATVLRDALSAWPARATASIATDLGIAPDPLHAILQQHIVALLAETADRFEPAAGIHRRGNPGA